LGIFAYIVVNRTGSTIRDRDKAFVVEDPESITRVEINLAGKSTVIEKNAKQWLVNGNEGDIKRVVEMLMISGHIEIAAPVSDNLADSLESLVSEGVEVRFFEEGKKVQAFRLCKLKSRLYARNFRSKKIFRISVKGYPSIDLTRVYDPLPDAWISNTLIALRPDEIKQVSIAYPANGERDFVFTVSGNANFSLQYDDDAKAPVSSDLALGYLSSFSGIRYTALPDSIKHDTAIIGSLRPLFILDILTVREESLRIKGFQKHDRLTGKTDPFRFYAITYKKGYIYLNYSDFDAILVSPEYFLKK
jgi:hypothetical protein